MQSVIVTGATSFIGRHLIKKLSEEGWLVYAVLRQGSSLSGENIVNIELKMEEYSHLAQKINAPCDAFVALAWDGTRGLERLEEDRQRQNYEYSLAALKESIKLGCRMVITAGSQAEYGFIQHKIKEEELCQPNTAYGKWKLSFYQEVERICTQEGIAYKEPRFFSLYGKDDSAQTMIASILDNMLRNEDCKLTQCIQMWDFLYIDDAIEGMYRLLTTKCKDGVYNFGSGDTRALKEFVLEMLRITNSESKLLFGDIAYPPSGMVNAWPDISKLKRETGWEPQVTFQDGIKRILKYKLLDGENVDEKNINSDSHI